MPSDGLRGRGLLQSEAEWDTRNRILADTLADLIDRYIRPGASRALDVGCQHGELTDAWAQRTQMHWWGIDPGLSDARTTAAGAVLSRAPAHELPFPDGYFDCLMFANVYEHLLPQHRRESLVEMQRVLRPGGIVVGQLPNPWFPIESHSRLPFMGWLPVRAQKVYWRLAPVPWEHDFYVVTIKDVMEDARQADFELARVERFNYPLEVIPRAVRWAAHLLEAPMRRFPWAWQFVLRRPSGE